MIAIIFITYILIALGFAFWANSDSASGELSLNALTPITKTLNEIGAAEISHIHPILWASCVITSAFFALLALKSSHDKVTKFASSAAASALFAGLFGIEVWITPTNTLLKVGLGVTSAATFLFIAGALWAKDLAIGNPKEEREHLSFFDLPLLAIATILGLYLRFYALNQVLNYFEGELSPYMAGATTLQGITLANIGFKGPWAPLGYFYYLPIYVSTALFGQTLLAVRIASAVVSAASIPLIYIAVHKLTGRMAAVFASFFMAFDVLQVGWGRSDIHPHGSTLWLTLLLVLATQHFFTQKTWRSSLPMILLMGLSFHQYPSGQFAVLIPFIHLALSLIYEAGARKKILIKSLLLPIGLTLWVLGWPLQYWIGINQWSFPSWYTLFGNRTSWSADSLHGSSDPLGMLAIFWTNSKEMVQGLFVYAPKIFFQDFIPNLGDLPNRTAPWFISALGILAVILALTKKTWRPGLIYVSWGIAGAAPLILSSASYAKRAATFYPAVMSLAAFFIFQVVSKISVSWLRRYAASLSIGACVLYLPIANSLWFSGNQYKYGTPEGISFAEKLKGYIRPGTILVVDSYDTYMAGRVSYLLTQEIVKESNQPFVVYFPQQNAPTVPLLTDPSSILDTLLTKGNWYYLWTDLRETLPPLRFATWKRIVYVATNESFGTEHQPFAARAQDFEKACPSAAKSVFSATDPRYRALVYDCGLGIVASVANAISQ